MDHLFVIPTEAEGSHGSSPESAIKMTRLRVDLFEVAEPMFFDLVLRTRLAQCKSNPENKDPGAIFFCVDEKEFYFLYFPCQGKCS